MNDTKLIFCLLGLLVHKIAAQVDNLNLNPLDTVTISILNSYTMATVPNAQIEIQQIHFYKNKFHTIANAAADKDGQLRTAWDWDTEYQLNISAPNFFSQVIKPKKNHFYQRKMLISLRPNNLAIVNGRLQLPKGVNSLPEDANLLVTNLLTGEQQRLPVDAYGAFLLYGENGQKYELRFEAENYEKSIDTIDLSQSQLDFKPIKNSEQDANVEKNVNLNTVEINLQSNLKLTEKAKIVNYKKDDELQMSVNFEQDNPKTTKINSNSFPQLDSLANLLAKNPSMRVEIVVAANSPKSPRQNWLLARKRVQLVDNYLKNQQVKVEQYQIVPSIQTTSNKEQELNIHILSN
jgi:outer membrane protein OmpA-like peptidoglycan-associated protein